MLKEVIEKAAADTIESYKVEPESEKERGLETYDPDKKRYPSIHLSTDVIPEIKDWENDKEYVVVLRVKQTGSSSYNGRFSADFDIKEAAVIDADAADEDDEKEKKEPSDDSSDELKDYMDGQA